MADRTVYGLNFSENGWRMVDQGSCVWVRVPGTTVTLQIREGQPADILGAFAADFNEYVEPLRDGDSGAWTATNSVASSNHLSGTAMDLNWNGPDGKTFRLGISKEQAYPGQKARVLDELLAFYEKLVFCGGEWSIRDWMHFQMGGNTYGAKNVDRVNDFIRRKIGAHGFSTFRRGSAPQPPPPPPMSPPLSKMDQYALEVKREGERRGITPRGIQIAFSVCFVESNWKMYANSNVPESLKYPHDAVGRDHDSVGLFQQRHPMWGPLDVLMNAAKSAGLFYDRLAKMNYNDPNRRPGDFAADVQRPAAQYRGRYQERFGEAVSLYNKLSGTAPPPSGGFLDMLTAEEQRALYNEIMGQRPSRSPLRGLGQGNVGRPVDLLLNTDGSVHVLVMQLLATLRNPGVLSLLRELAAADPVKYPDRQGDRQLAQAILAESGAAETALPGVVHTPFSTAQKVVVEEEPILVEVLPAVQEQPAPAVYEQPAPVSQNTPAELLDTLERLKIFNEAYREKFEALTEGENK